MIRQMVRRCVLCVCLVLLVKDWLTGHRLRKGNRNTDSGRRHRELDLDGSVSYIRKVFDDYLSYGGIKQFTGRVCEIGPGDNFGVAALILGSGATGVVAVDRFYSERDPAQQARIYGQLAAEEGLDGVFEGAPAEETLRGLEYQSGQAAEEFFKGKPSTFDCIISRAVLEHLYDPIGALDDMKAALKPGGIIVHRIDLRDHGMFEGKHPQTFLTIPNVLYTRMVRNSGKPNRVLLPHYQEWLERSGLDGRIGVTRLVGHPEEFDGVAWSDISAHLRARAIDRVKVVKRRMVSDFRQLRDEDLAVSGIVLVAAKSQA